MTEESYLFFNNQPGVPYEISQAQYDYMLGVLPPIYGKWCFAVGEPCDFVNGRTTYYWAARIRDTLTSTKYWCVYGIKEQAEKAFEQLRAHAERIGGTS